MGALSYVAAGLAGGIGKGAASYGVDLMRQADQRDLEAQKQADRMELLQARQAGGSGGGKVSLSPAQKLYEFGQMMLSGGNGAVRGALMAGGMEPGAAADASGMMQGQQPTTTVDMPADRFTSPDRQDDAAMQPRAAQAPKYSDGQAVQLMEQSRVALRRAMGMLDPGTSDSVAKAESTEQTTGLVRRFVDGDNKAGEGALIAQGKDVVGASGNAVTGAVPKGSVAESTVRENLAQAGQAGAAASKYNAERDKVVAEIDGELQKGATQERLTTMLEKLNTYAKDSNLPDAELAEVNKLRQEITRQMREDVFKRGKPGAGAGGKVDPAKALADAKAAIARGAPRDKVIERLRSVGVDPKGL